jgi:hypothetical protein
VDHAAAEGLFDLGAEPADVDLHAVAAALQKGGQLGAGDGLAAMGIEVLQNGQLGGRQGERDAVDGGVPLFQRQGGRGCPIGSRGTGGGTLREGAYRGRVRQEAAEGGFQLREGEGTAETGASLREGGRLGGLLPEDQQRAPVQVGKARAIGGREGVSIGQQEAELSVGTCQ